MVLIGSGLLVLNKKQMLKSLIPFVVIMGVKQEVFTDDLGEGFWVYVERFSPTRQKSTQFPWHMEYSLEATVLDWS